MESSNYEDRASEQFNAIADAIYFRVELEYGIEFGLCLPPKRQAILSGSEAGRIQCGGERLGLRASRHVSGRAPPRFAFRPVEINLFVPVY
jgi:hypothetical protein